MKNGKWACVWAVVLVVLSQVTAALAGGYDPQPGQLHPDFVLPRIDSGQPLQLSDFRGRRVLLMHFASW